MFELPKGQSSQNHTEKTEGHQTVAATRRDILQITNGKEERHGTGRGRIEEVSRAAGSNSIAVITKMMELENNLMEDMLDSNLHEVQVQAWSYIVEAPESPNTNQAVLSNHWTQPNDSAHKPEKEI